MRRQWQQPQTIRQRPKVADCYQLVLLGRLHQAVGHIDRVLCRCVRGRAIPKWRTRKGRGETREKKIHSDIVQDGWRNATKRNGSRFHSLADGWKSSRLLDTWRWQRSFDRRVGNLFTATVSLARFLGDRRHGLSRRDWLLRAPSSIGKLGLQATSNQWVKAAVQPLPNGINFFFLTLRRPRKPKDFRWLPVDKTELPKSFAVLLFPASSLLRCLVLLGFRFLIRGGVRKARIGDGLRALAGDCSVLIILAAPTEGDNVLESSPSTCILAALSDGNAAAEPDMLPAFSSKSIRDNSTADWLKRWRRRNELVRPDSA